MRNEEWGDKHIFFVSKKVAWNLADYRNRYGYYVDVDELTQDIAERLVKARKKYSEEHGVPLSAYMNKHISWAIKDSYRDGFAIADSNSSKFKYRKNRKEKIYHNAEEYNTTEHNEKDEGHDPVFAQVATEDTYPLIEYSDFKPLFSHLGDRERMILFLKVFVDVSIEEISSITGWSEATIHKLQKRTHLKCQNFLENELLTLKAVA